MFQALEKHLEGIREEKMCTEVDSFVGNHTLVDPEIFQLWLGGYSANETSAILQGRGALDSFHGATIDLLLSDVYDHYRTYSMIEKFLQNPPRLQDQLIFQLDSATVKMMIKKYYEFDDLVMREIMGKKLSSRLRKDLDEVSEKTNVNLRSCRRQFDNTKRIFKAVEELPGSLLQNIKLNFHLPDELAKKYSAIVFLTSNRFETNKKKLQYLCFGDFYNCAHFMMSHWTNPIEDEDNNSDVEREFLMELRELRSLLDKEKEHKGLVLQKIKGQVCDRIFTEVEHNFKVYSRTLINIAYGLNHSKELKDLFIDLVEKFIEPCKHLQWPCMDLKVFLEAYTETACHMEVLKSQPNLKTVFRRYMEGICGCIISIYHS